MHKSCTEIRIEKKIILYSFATYSLIADLNLNGGLLLLAVIQSLSRVYIIILAH